MGLTSGGGRVMNPPRLQGFEIKKEEFSNENHRSYHRR